MEHVWYDSLHVVMIANGTVEFNSVNRKDLWVTIINYS